MGDDKGVLCPARVRDMYSGSYACGRKASYEYEGFYYCKTHHPPTKAARDEARAEASRAKAKQLMAAFVLSDLKRDITKDIATVEVGRRVRTFLQSHGGLLRALGLDADGFPK